LKVRASIATTTTFDGGFSLPRTEKRVSTSASSKRRSPCVTWSVSPQAIATSPAAMSRTARRRRPARLSRSRRTVAYRSGAAPPDSFARHVR
jgi:hypothetical protein